MTTNTVAQTILEQVGGNMTAAMIGIKHAVSRENGLGIRFAAKSVNGSNHIEITLEVIESETGLRLSL